MARPVVQEPADTPPVTRLSPLYCRYNGFLLGQFLFLAFAECGRPRYAERRSRLLECLREIDIDVLIPAAPHDAGAVTYAGLLSAILPRLAQQARELAEFAILGGLWRTTRSRRAATPTRGGDAARDRAPARRLRSAADHPARFASPGDHDPDRVAAPSLAYLREMSRACRSSATPRSSSCRMRRPTPPSSPASIGRRSSIAAFARCGRGTGWPASITPSSSWRSSTRPACSGPTSRRWTTAWPAESARRRR